MRVSTGNDNPVLVPPGSADSQASFPSLPFRYAVRPADQAAGLSRPSIRNFPESPDMG